MHVLAANGALSNANAETMQPCQYEFPVDNLDDAIALAQSFTDVTLGVLPVAQSRFASDGGDEAGLIPIIGSIIGQEGEQNGLYRYLQKKLASAAPMLTGGALQFSYSVLSQFTVSGSCPNIDVIGLTALPKLDVVTTQKEENSAAIYKISGTVSDANASMVYMSGQNVPVTVPISNVTLHGGETYFFAPFPYAAINLSRGLTLGALVSGYLPQFNTTSQVAAATMYGPILIEID